MVDIWLTPWILRFAWPMHWISSIRMILLRWHSGTRTTTQFHSQEMVWSYASYSHGTAWSEYERTNRNGCLLIPRGMQFTKELFPEIVVLWNHAAPYHDPKTGKEAPFITSGTFQQHGHTFPRCCIRDLELYTTEEVMSLRSAGVVKSSSDASLSLSKLSSFTSLAQIQSATPATPKIIPGSPKVELDSSSKRQDYTSSLKSHKHPVSAAAGSSTSLERSDEWDHDAECMRHDKDKGHDKNRERSRECEGRSHHQKGKSLHMWACFRAWP